MSRKNWIVADKKNYISHDRQIIKRPAHLSIVLGLEMNLIHKLLVFCSLIRNFAALRNNKVE